MFVLSSVTDTYCPASQEWQWRHVCLQCYQDLKSIDHLCIKPIRRTGLIHKWSIDSRCSSGDYKLMFYLTIVNKTRCHCHSWLAEQYLLELEVERENNVRNINVYKRAEFELVSAFVVQRFILPILTVWSWQVLVHSYQFNSDAAYASLKRYGFNIMYLMPLVGYWSTNWCFVNRWQAIDSAMMHIMSSL